MFKYLTQRILPDFKFQKKFEEDIFEVMKLLKYPFIDSISPKSLLSIGALHSNPSFFGLLHYMVGICKVNDGLNKTPQDMTLSQPSSRTSVVSYSGGGDPITSGQLFHEYSVDTYHAFMAGENDFTEQTEKLKQVFGKAI
jgi:kinetochore protein NDC80